MTKQIDVTTPENVTIEYELAGVASRAGAIVLDSLILVLIAVTLALSKWALDKYVKLTGITWINALIIVLGFVISEGYFIYFETVWNGQTPGKRYARMRTIREGGLPIDFSCAAMRNLVRVVDFFPFFYLLGGIVIVFSKYSKRLGDYAAGTIVVKERAEWKGDLHAAAHEQPKITRYAEAAHVKNIELVTPQEFEAISRFLERQAEFQSNAREQLAAKIAQPLMARLGIEENTELRYVGLLSEIHKLCVDERGMR